MKSVLCPTLQQKALGFVSSRAFLLLNLAIIPTNRSSSKPILHSQQMAQLHPFWQILFILFIGVVFNIYRNFRKRFSATGKLPKGWRQKISEIMYYGVVSIYFVISQMKVALERDLGKNSPLKGPLAILYHTTISETPPHNDKRHSFSTWASLI